MNEVVTFIFALSSQLKGKMGFRFHDSLQFQEQLSLIVYSLQRRKRIAIAFEEDIPQANYSIFLKNSQLIDFEYAANVYGNAEFDPFSDSDFNVENKKLPCLGALFYPSV